jgi:hypothetical protein
MTKVPRPQISVIGLIGFVGGVASKCCSYSCTPYVTTAIRNVVKERPQISIMKTLTVFPGLLIPTAPFNLVPRYVNKIPIANSITPKNSAALPA